MPRKQGFIQVVFFLTKSRYRKDLSHSLWNLVKKFLITLLHFINTVK